MIFGALPVQPRRKSITTANKQIKKEQPHELSNWNSTHRRGRGRRRGAPIQRDAVDSRDDRDQHLLCRRSYLRTSFRPIRGARFVCSRVHHLLDDHPLHRGAGRIDLLPRLGRLDVEDPRHGSRARPPARGNAPYLLPAELDLLLRRRDHLANDGYPRYRLRAWPYLRVLYELPTVY